MVLSVKWESSDSAAARSDMPSSLESLAESSLNEKEQKTKTRGKCVCRWASAQGKAFRKPAQVHTVTAPEAHLPHYRVPLLPTMCQGVLGSGHTQKPNPEPATCPTLQGSQRVPEPCASCPYLWLLPRHPHTPHCTHWLISLSALVGAKKLAHSGAKLPSVISGVPQMGKYLTSRYADGVLPL